MRTLDGKTLPQWSMFRLPLNDLKGLQFSRGMKAGPAFYRGEFSLVETGDTFLANATIKAVATSQLIGDYVLADDSGLECDALNGAPGVFSARYGGIPSSAEKNNAKLLQELERVGATMPPQRSGRFRCVLVLAKEGEVLGSFDGACEGTISFAPKGTNGFGYDPLFIPQGYARSFGQLTEKTKMSLSHRGLALKRFMDWCKTNLPG